MKKFIPIVLMGASFLVAQCGSKNIDSAKSSQPSKLVSKKLDEKTMEPVNDLALNNDTIPPQDDELNQDAKSLIKRLHELYGAEDSAPSNVSTSPKSAKYVKFSDIKQWRAAGDDHAAGYDANGKLLAIYDLTYQSTLSGEFVGRSILGTIGVSDVNLTELIRLIRKAIEEKKNQGAQAGNVHPSGPMNSDDFSMVNKVLNKIDRKYGSLRSPLVGEWWKQIPLKRNLDGKKTVDAAQYFKLSDIDFESMMSQTQMLKFNTALKVLQDNISKLLSMDASHLLDELAVQRNASGNFDLVQVRRKTLAANEQPDKVVDFVRYQSSFGYALLYLLIKTALSELASAIPQKAVAAVVKYAIDRWFELYEEQLSFHRFRAFEYIDEAERGDPSPFSFLTAKERMKGGVYVLSHEASIFYTIFMPRGPAYYYQSMQTELATVQNNKIWTQKKNLTLSPLSSLYFEGDDQKPNGLDYLLIMGAQPRFAKRPLIGVNYQRPYDERIKRNFLKAMYDVLQAIQLPYPGIDFLISTLYSVFIMDDIRDGIRWEARLASYLSDYPGRDFSKEIGLIYAQRVNPFEFDVDEERAFVERSKAYIGL